MNHCSLGKYRVRFLWATGHVIFVKWLIHNLGFGVWFKDTLIKTYCWSINVKFTVNKQHNNFIIMKLSNTHIFSIRHITVFLHLGTLFGGHFKQWNHQKITEVKKLWKGCLVSVWKLKQESRTSPCLTSAGNMHIKQLKFCTTLCMSANDYKWHKYWFGVCENVLVSWHICICRHWKYVGWTVRLNPIPSVPIVFFSHSFFPLSYYSICLTIIIDSNLSLISPPTVFKKSSLI